MKQKTLATLGLTLTALLLLHACAKQAYPTGGPKDETPPVVLGTTPQNGTTNFDAKEFLIMFDEYVQVKSADENILVSPPMKHKPEYGTKGRGILVKIKDTLRENTTYLFQFKEGIVDFNEGNPLKSFEYVFSTGKIIDSMTLRGQVTDAFTGQPWKETVTVVAYRANSEGDTSAQLLPSGDSIVAKEHPMYMTRCDKEGNFELNHLRAGHYLLLAYEDGDKNLRLGTSEAAAFLDTLVIAQAMPAPIDTATHDTAAAPDSIATDKTEVPDSIAADTSSLPDTLSHTLDSTHSTNTIVPIAMHISLFKKEAQRVTQCEFKRRSYIEIVTQCPLSDSTRVSTLYDTTNHLYYQFNRTRDTLHIWTSRKDCDSITLLLTDTNLNDTLRAQYRENKSKIAAKPALVEMKPAILRGRVASNHPYFDTLWIDVENPIADSTSGIGDSIVRVLHLSDSSVSYCGVVLADNLQPSGSNRVRINFTGKAGEKYKFTILPNHFTDIYGHNNADSLHINTEFTKTENYGNIILDLTVATSSDGTPLLLQLTNEKGDILQQHIVTANCRLTFANLRGGKYKLRAIVDNDRNRQWTPGDYWQRRQPERIIHFEKTLELRENWDMEEKWTIELESNNFR